MENVQLEDIQQQHPTVKLKGNPKQHIMDVHLECITQQHMEKVKSDVINKQNDDTITRL